MAGDTSLARIADYVANYEYLEESQFDWKSRAQRWWQRWHNDPSLHLRARRGAAYGPPDATDTRPALKDWQHLLISPHGFINEQAQTQAMSNLIAEASPPFKARGWQLEDVPTESPLESLVNYEFAVLNPVTEWVRDTFTRGFVQGIAPLKARYLNEGFDINMLPRQWDIERFQQRLKAALQLVREAQSRGDAEARNPPGLNNDGSLNPVAFSEKYQQGTMQAFAQWAAGVFERYGIEVPMPPVGRTQRVARHVGLDISHVELCDIAWDPRIGTMRRQKRVFQRLVGDKYEILESCRRQNERAVRDGRKPPFDLDAIEALQPGLTVRGVGYPDVGEYTRNLMQWLGINEDPIRNPALKNAIDILEVWEPADSLGRSYWCWIGQRSEPLTREGYYPLPIPVHPYACFVNIPTPGQLVGKSDYDIHAQSHDHLDTMRGYQADYVALAVGQPIIRKGGSGSPGRALEIRPFEVFDEDEGIQYGQALNFQAQLQGIAEYTALLKAEIDQGMATSGAGRGEDAPLARVGVGEVQLRAANQNNRPRDKMHRLGTMCSRDLIPLGIMLVWQFGHPDHVMNVAGADPFELMATDTLWPAMQANHIVMPAALISEAALAVQQFQETIKVAKESGCLVQGGKAAIAILGRLMSLQRIQGAEQVLALMRQDLDEAEQKGGAQQQLQQSQQQLQAVQSENDKLRAKIGVPSAQELQAEIDAINAGQAPPPGGPGPEGAPPGAEPAPAGGPPPAPPTMEAA